MRIGISGIIWGDSDRLARREGGLTVGQVVFPPVMNAQARAEVKRIKEQKITAVAVQPAQPVDTYTPTAEQERRAADMLSRAMARRDRNSTGLG
jgi:hypothetical protein